MMCAVVQAANKAEAEALARREAAKKRCAVSQGYLVLKPVRR
jgi:hypothetical protein